MVELQKETNPELNQEQQEFLVELDMQTLEAKNFLKKMGYVILTEQEFVNIKVRAIVWILLGVSPGLLLGYALCTWLGG